MRKERWIFEDEKIGDFLGSWGFMEVAKDCLKEETTVGRREGTHVCVREDSDISFKKEEKLFDLEGGTVA